MLFPLVAHLQRAAMLDPRIRQRLSSRNWPRSADAAVPAESLGLLGELLGIPRPRPGRGARLDAIRKRKLLFEAIGGRLEAMARQRPVVVTIEDIHWLDPSSRELVASLVPRISSIPVLMILTTRSGEIPTWVSEAHVTVLDLGAIDQQARTLWPSAFGARRCPMPC
jgi:hypothetical protein